MVQLLTLLVTVVASLCLVGFAGGQEVGDVVELSQETNLRVGKVQGDKVPRGAKLIVSAKNGKWLWVEYNKPGWVDTAMVTIVEKAGASWKALEPAEKKEAVKQLWKAGASIEFSEEGDVESVSTAFREMPPGSLKHVALLDGVKTLVLISSSLTDDDLVHLANLRKLEYLFLGVNKIQGKGLANLKDVASLKGLYLMLTPLDDEGLAHLPSLPALEELRLSQTGVTDKGLALLAKQTRLVSLELGGNAITEAGAKDLAKLANLKFLDLSGTKVNDAGLAELALEAIEVLSLYNCKAVTKEGIAHLARFKRLSKLGLADIGTLDDAAMASLAEMNSLTGLDISGNRVTDEGLVHLQRLTKLEELRLRGNRYSKSGLAALRKALPKAEIQE